MGLFNKDRKDAKYVAPKDAIGCIFPYIMPRRCDAEVSCTEIFDITELCKYVDELNESGKYEYKITYFHALLFVFGMTIRNRKGLNRFVKNKRLYERNVINFSFTAKNKLSDEGEERLVSIDLDLKDDLPTFSRKVAVDVFNVKHTESNHIEGVLNFFLHMPRWLLSIIVKFVFFLDKHGWSPKIITEGDTNYATILFSNLGSIRGNSIYHHLNEYGTNSIVATMGSIKEDKGKKYVDFTFTLDERIGDGFYFVKSVKLAEYIATRRDLLEGIMDVEVKMPSKK